MPVLLTDVAEMPRFRFTALKETYTKLLSLDGSASLESHTEMRLLGRLPAEKFFDGHPITATEVFDGQQTAMNGRYRLGLVTPAPVVVVGRM